MLLTKKAAFALKSGARPRAIISTDQLDSENDRIMQDGLKPRARMRVNLMHDVKTKMPVGLVTDLFSYPDRTEAEWEWFKGDADVDRVKNLYDQGAFDASVDLIVLDAVRNSSGGFDYR